MNILQQTKNIYERLIVNDTILAKIDSECRSDLKKERFLREKFSNSYPKIKKLPCLGNVASFVYSQGVKNLACLIAVIIIFTVIKAPYFNTPFTGASHSLKYNSYVEPALYMVENNSLFGFQHKYKASPVTNPDGISEKIGHLPLMEWGLFSFYKLIPSGSIEFKTHVFTHFIGVLILLFSYFFFCKSLPKNFTLIAILLIAVNPIFSLASFVTVADSLIILFMFISLLVLNKYFENKDIGTLFWAGMLFGIGNSMKYSLMLWLAPLSLLLIYYNKKDNITFIRDYTLYIIMSIIPIITVKTSISWLPSSFFRAIIMLLIWVLIYFGIYLFLKHYQKRINQWAEVLLKHFFSLICLAISIAFIGYIIFNYFIANQYLISNFFTDKYLLFNFKFYKYMLLTQFKEYLTADVFAISIIGFMILCMAKQSSVKKLLTSFIAGSLFYWIVASKPMFIHNYYTLILIITGSLLATTTIYYIVTSISSKNVKFLILLLFTVLIVPRTYSATIKILNQHEDLSKVTQFVLDNTQKDEFILHEGYFGNSLIFSTGRSFVRTYRLNNDKFKQEIKTMGFSKTMKKYRIKYLFTPFKKPTYIDFAPLFGETNIKEPSYNRTYFIYNRIKMRQCEDLKNAFEDIDNIVHENRLDNKFKLEAEIGKFKFFSFVN